MILRERFKYTRLLSNLMTKTIKISDENYHWLLTKSTELQRKRSAKISFDDTLNELRKEKNMEILKLAGSLKMSKKEADDLISEIYNERKVTSRRL